ncbi:hypothetical protein AKO1_009400 [Acrasis kona]|uniref:Uncharacterized protein n=1 Tax=Acrasis kona TaxID=1008807 RepID=A0AAW2ZKU8_9EUKA
MSCTNSYNDHALLNTPLQQSKRPGSKILGQIKVTRNISATRTEVLSEPLDFPESGVLYVFHTDKWANKMSFYDKVAYSFGIPSTQKPVHCSYLNTRVMHYERTCQGVYYCKHHNESNEQCTVKPARFRFHACAVHKQSLQKSTNKCPVKLHFYVPIDTNDHRRLLLCLNDHNHALLRPTKPIAVRPQATNPSTLSPSPLSPGASCDSPSVLSTPSPIPDSPLTPRDDVSVATTVATKSHVHTNPTRSTSVLGVKRSHEEVSPPIHLYSQPKMQTNTPTITSPREGLGHHKRMKLSASSECLLSICSIVNSCKPEMLHGMYDGYDEQPNSYVQLPSISTLGLDFRF